MYYLVYLNGFCNGNKGGHALDTSATPQQTQKYIKKARSISKLSCHYALQSFTIKHILTSNQIFIAKWSFL